MNELMFIEIKKQNVEQQTESMLMEKFSPFIERAIELADKAKSIIVTDATQLTEMKLARESRLIMRQIRIDADKTRKELKEDSLRYGKAVQGAYNLIESVISPIEEYLETQEKFAENQEKKRQDALRAERQAVLDSYQVFLPSFGDLGKMADFEFERIISIANSQKEKQELEVKQEEEKKEAERIENDRIRLENAELQKQKDVLNKQLAEEQAKAAQELRKQKEKDESEAKQAIAKENERKKFEAAPDNEKLLELARLIGSIQFPSLLTLEANSTAIEVRGLLGKVVSFINVRVNK